MRESLGVSSVLLVQVVKRGLPGRHTRFKQTEPLAKLPGDWGWAQSSALLVNTIALDRRLDILSG